MNPRNRAALNNRSAQHVLVKPRVCPALQNHFSAAVRCSVGHSAMKVAQKYDGSFPLRMPLKAMLRGLGLLKRLVMEPLRQTNILFFCFHTFITTVTTTITNCVPHTSKTAGNSNIRNTESHHKHDKNKAIFYIKERTGINHKMKINSVSKW